MTCLLPPVRDSIFFFGQMVVTNSYKRATIVMDTDSYRTENTVKWCRCRHTETTTKERRYRHFSVFYRYSITVFRYLSSALYESLRTAYDNTYGLTANHNGQQLKTCRKKYRYRNKVFSGICHPYCKKAFI